MTPHHPPLKTALGLALTLGAIAPAAANARFDLNRPTRPTSPPPQPAIQVVRLSAPSGFDWSSAGIGAAGGFGLSILALGGGLLIAERGQHIRPRAHRPPTERPHRRRPVASPHHEHPDPTASKDHR
jgi:hypothetical protein